MKYLILTILLTGCVSYKKDGEWVTESLFTMPPPRATESHRITVEVVTRDNLDIACNQFGIVRGCTIQGRVYVKGTPKTVTMLLSAKYINGLPFDSGFAGDRLADKLGIELSFNDRATLGHEILEHAIK